MLPSKAVKTGDKLYFLNSAEVVHCYTVTAICLAIPEETARYTMGFFIQDESGVEDFLPDWVVLGFLRDGNMWREGHEKIAKVLRDNRARQRGEHENNSHNT